MPTLALKLRGEITRSTKRGYQWSHKRTYILQIIFLKKIRFYEPPITQNCQSAKLIVMPFPDKTGTGQLSCFSLLQLCIPRAFTIDAVPTMSK